MSLGEELEALKRPKKASSMPPLIEAILLDQKDPAVQEQLLESLKGNQSAEGLAGVLRRHGYQISASTIRSFRRGLRRDSQ